MKIWVDDIRTPPDDTWVWYKTSIRTIVELSKQRILGSFGEEISIMSLDHDLGGDDTTRPIVLWCCENDFWPVEVRCHSSNPPGREWIEKMIERYHGANS